LEVRPAAIEGAGLALWSTRGGIKAGERLLGEVPLLLGPAPSSASPEQLAGVETLSRLRFDALTKPQQDKLLALSDAYRQNDNDKPSLMGVILSNQLPAGVGPGGSSAMGGLFELLCRAQHSCAPNCEYSFNTSLGRGVLHAIRSIGANEELTICYLSSAPRLTFEQRQEALQLGFRFRCACAVCTRAQQDEEFRDASDRRRTRIAALWEQLDDVDAARVPLDSLALTKEMRTVMAQEGFGHASSIVGRMHFRLFQICICHRALLSLARASLAACVSAYTLARGKDCDALIAGGYAALLDKPDAHPDFACLDDEQRVPKGTDAEALARELTVEVAAAAEATSTASSQPEPRAGEAAQAGAGAQ